MKHPVMFALLLFALAPLAVYAQSEPRTLQEAVQRVERETGGKILSAETLLIDGRTVYRIKVLTPEGRVQVVQVRARD